MEKHLYGFLLIFSIIISLALLSFVSCILAEFKKAKKEEVRLDNKLCYLPESRAFGFGIAALAFLVIAQVIGNMIICRNFWLRKEGITSKTKRPNLITIAFLVLSWMSFGVAVIILSAATSMSRKQEYGKGWLDQDCYIVKDGVYFGSGILVLLCIAATLATSFLTLNKPQPQQPSRIHHAQVL
ncbi:hypothetical protein JCGZ_06716 [Jatropha curcas]|uniref:Uncharacterized protein n=1 Tax=Jatropha curcas TaxID=180498 RepID=A0A067L150_JATCU|nr:protein MODIFYING WALL LIGNIN-2 [Jatropha curcas]KDP37814.1 hypothetical protein JCGZ_06716 [Jatropha curcas]